MTLREYLDSLKDKTVAVIGIGVSNTPLLRLLLREKIRVTACDKRDRAALGALAEELEKDGCRLQLGEDYLRGLDQDVIFRTLGCDPMYRSCWQLRSGAVRLPRRWRYFSRCAPVH